MQRVIVIINKTIPILALLLAIVAYIFHIFSICESQQRQKKRKMESRTAVRREPSGTHSVSRWSPTKEQIAMLENLYKQGIRTPNTEQIQEITSRLRTYGHIQGKNVFYWFQNHKARQKQKQKQKQQSIGYSNSFLHASHPIGKNVVWTPFYSQQCGMNFYPQPGKIVPAGGIIETVVPFGMLRMCDGQQRYEPLQGSLQPDYNYSISDTKTLTLFPLHPTGILEEKTTNQVSSHASVSIDVDENQQFMDI